MDDDKLRIDPVFGFRVPEKKKAELMAEIEAIKKLANRGKQYGIDRKTKKNELILEALEIGFKELRKKYQKK